MSRNFLACLSAGACGGDGGGGTTPPVDYTSYQAQSAALHAIWDAVAVTDPATLPAGGSASYTGVMRLDAQLGAGSTSMAGALNLVANFAADSISGSANNFYDDADNSMTGSLVISNGVLDRAANTAIEYTFSSVLAGTLAGGGENFVISADLSGDFLGPSFGAVVGVIAGTATTGFGSGYLFGEFIAAQ
ncbi:MAG: hypothetical protein ACU0DI_03755 [Paracoccaceae bacterium]